MCETDHAVISFNNCSDLKQICCHVNIPDVLTDGLLRATVFKIKYAYCENYLSAINIPLMFLIT